MKIAAYIFGLIALSVGSFLPPGLAPSMALEVPVAGDNGSNETVSLYANSYALVIGIDEYQDGWPPLNNAVRDAREVAAAMEARGFQVTLIENPKGRDLDRAIEEFFVLRGENPDDRLFMWFAGHGYTENGEGYLIPADGLAPEMGARFRLSAIRLRDINTYVRLAQSKHVYAVFDSCFAGTIFDNARARPPATITRAATKPVRQFLTSGDAYQKVSDDGSFRELFLRALAGDEASDLNKDGYLTASELGTYITNRVTNLTQGQQTPRAGKLRDKDYDQGDFIFELPRAQSIALIPKTQSSSPQSGSLQLQQMQMESQFWDSIKNSQDPADFEDFMFQFPKGTFTRLAKRRVDRLKAAQQPPKKSLPEIEVASIAPKVVAKPRITAAKPKSSTEGATCKSTEAAMQAPILALFSSWEALDLEQYMAQWAEDAIQFNVSGKSRNKATIFGVRKRLFNRLRSVSVEYTDINYIESIGDVNVFENIYTMEFRFKSGKIVREENDRETYRVRCDPDKKRWVIARNTDQSE